jgi:hypothetical protein
MLMSQLASPLSPFVEAIEPGMATDCTKRRTDPEPVPFNMLVRSLQVGSLIAGRLYVADAGIGWFRMRN